MCVSVCVCVCVCERERDVECRFFGCARPSPLAGPAAASAMCYYDLISRLCAHTYMCVREYACVRVCVRAHTHLCTYPTLVRSHAHACTCVLVCA